jgi:hypothetical protein
MSENNDIRLKNSPDTAGSADKEKSPPEPGILVAALIVVILTIIWFYFERSFEPLIAFILSFSGLFGYITIKSKRVNWLLAGLLVIMSVGGFLIIRCEQEPNIVIVDIFHDGTGNNEPDEFVTIRNDDMRAVQLRGWTLKDKSIHEFPFPDFEIQPGQVCRVYTNEDHPESCGFNFRVTGSAVWNNTGGDCAYLRDDEETLIDEFCYE